MFKGRPYRRARRPLVILGTYYGLCIAHEVAYRFGVPVAFPVMLLLVAGPIVALFVWDARTPRRRGVCANCGYDLRATPDRCPECGAIPAPAARRAA